MLSRLLTLVVWALVAAAAVFWGVKLIANPRPVPAHAQVAVPGAAPGGDLSRLLGAGPAPTEVVAEAPPPPPPEASRFQLIGVVAARRAPTSQGVALIAVDGKSARAFRVGTVIDGDLVLQSVQARGAVIGQRGGASRVTLELPPLAPPATGVPGVAGNVAGASPGLLPPMMPGQAPGAQPPISPPQLAIQGFPSGVAPNFGNLPQARLRGMRSPAGPPGVVQPGAAGSAQEETVLPNEPSPALDGRNLR
jgi:general secretion pathway protein C